MFERAQRIDWETGEHRPVSDRQHVANVLVDAFGKLWLGAWLAAAVAGVIYAGVYEIGWWALIVLICPVVVFLGSLRYR